MSYARKRSAKAGDPVIHIAKLTLVSEDRAFAANLKLRGPITAETSPVLENTLCSLMPKFRLIVLDFSQVDHVDSSGLSTLASMYVLAKGVNCDLEIDNPKLRLRDRFRNWWHSLIEGHEKSLG